MDEVKTIEVSSAGHEYVDHDHGVIIIIPKNAVPWDMVAHLEVAVLMYGPFVYLQDKAPISPVLWICFQEDVQLQKPLEIHLPHFLNLSSGNVLDEQVIVGKAAHKLNSKQEFVFEELLNVPVELGPNSRGIFNTNHCCCLCLHAGKKVVEDPHNSSYCVNIIEDNEEMKHIYNYCLTFKHKTCFKVLFLSEKSIYHV